MSRKVALIGFVLVALAALVLVAPAAPAGAQRQPTYTPYPTYTALPTYTVPPLGTPEPRATEAIPTPRTPAPPVPGGGRTYDDQFIVASTFTLAAGDTIDGDLSVFGGNATLERGSTVTGNILVGGGNLDSAADLRGELTVFGGNVVLEDGAVVADSVTIVGGNVELQDGVVVEEDVVVTGGSLDRDPGAVVRGDVREGAGPGAWPWFGPRFDWGDRDWNWPNPLGRLAGAVSSGVGLALLGVLLALIWPLGVQRTGAALIAYPAVSLGVGLLTLIVWPLAMVLIAVISIPLILVCIGFFGFAVVALMGLALAAASLLGWIALGVLIGERILRALNARQITPVLSALVGVFVLTLFSQLLQNVFCIGGLMNFALSAIGLGAVILTRFGTRPYFGGPPDASWRAAPPPPPAPPAAPVYPLRGPAAASDVPGASVPGAVAPAVPPRGPAAAGDVPAAPDKPVLTPVVIDTPPPGEPPAEALRAAESLAEELPAEELPAEEPPAEELLADELPAEELPPAAGFAAPEQPGGDELGPERDDAPIVPPAPPE